MSNSKSYNSIVFLTTLSVYLGLVLVGAPPILAQAALTHKIIEVQSKAENESDDKDCWDNAPKEIIDLLNSDFLSDGVLGFIKDIQNLIQIEKYDKGEKFDIQFEYKATEGGIAETSYSNINSGSQWIILAASEKVGNLASSSYYRYDQDLKVNSSHSNIRFSSENGDLTIKISFEEKSNKDAEDFTKTYNSTFEIGSCSRYIEERPKVIYQNSKASFENNQVFIVTRLPRGSLDVLLASKDAQ